MFLTLGEAGVFDPLWSDGAIEEMLRHLPQSMDLEARQAFLVEMTFAHLVVGRDAEQVAVVRRMVDLSQREAVGHLRKSVHIGVSDDVRRVEQVRMLRRVPVP